MELIFENDEMKIISEHSLDPILDEIIEYTKYKFELYRKLFKVDKLEKITMKIFDNLEEYREDAFKTRGVKSPDYSRGWFNSRAAESNICIELEKLQLKSDNPNRYHKLVATNSHESFHYYYKKYYYGNNRITWFDEGLAQYVSGEYDTLTEEEIRTKYMNFITNYIPITNLNERINGNKDVPDEIIFNRKDVFQGYDASFFCIKYLIENNGEEYLYNLMFNNDEILSLGNTILNDMIDFYNKKIVSAL